MPPGFTELLAVKEPIGVVVKVRLPLAESRSSNSTSDGELTRVGTCDVENVGGPLVRPTSERAGNTRYISTRTSPILLRSLVPEIRPVKVASVIEVRCVRTKSSADSISNFPVLSGGGRYFSVW